VATPGRRPGVGGALEQPVGVRVVLDGLPVADDAGQQAVTASTMTSTADSRRPAT
jgi:hypothetical protein